MKKLKKNKKFQMAGAVTLNPWSFPATPDVVQQGYQQILAQNPSVQLNSVAPPITPTTIEPTVDNQQNMTATRSFGSPNWDYIFGSQMVQSAVKGISNLSPNSRQNAVRRFNEEKFDPLNYLPRNPNVSQQDLFGMQKGGRTPIFTSDKNDPRLKKYSDSLNLWNRGRQFVKMVDEHYPTVPESFSKDNPKSDLRQINYKQMMDSEYARVNNLGFDKNPYMDKRFFDQDKYLYETQQLAKKTGIEPIGTWPFGRTGHSERFMKPVQPILYNPNPPIEMMQSLSGLMSVNRDTPSYGGNRSIPLFSQDIYDDAVYGNDNSLLGRFNRDLNVPKFLPSSSDMSDEEIKKQLLERGLPANTEVLKKGGFKLNPENKGDCTPMTKSTCTGKKRQFALNAKNHFKKHKKEDGGELSDEEAYDFMFADAETIPTAASLPTKQMQRAEKWAKEDAARGERDQADMDLYNTLFADTERSTRTRRQAIYGNSSYTPNESQSEIATQVKERLMQNGLPEHVASGFVGNFAAESSFNPGIKNSIGAFGLAQWLGDRKKNLFDFAKKQGKDPADPLVQADFVAWELNNTEKHNRGKILGSKDAREAAVNIMNHYERPAQHERESSVGRRVKAASMFKKGGINTTGYLDGSSTSKNPFNIIPSNDITMEGVSQPIIAIPDGSDIARIMQPGMNYHFPNSKSVLEFPLEDGEYDLSEEEIARLKRMGYKIDTIQ